MRIQQALAAVRPLMPTTGAPGGPLAMLLLALAGRGIVGGVGLRVRQRQ